MTVSEKTWCPAIELQETNDNLILKAEVPGVNLQDLHIHAERDSLAIAGIHPKENLQEAKELIASQLHYGQLQCNVPLPVAIQVEGVTAELIDGVLTVTMPKQNSIKVAS